MMNSFLTSYPLSVLALSAIIAPQVSAATLLDENFQNPILSNGTNNPAFSGWTYNNGNGVKARTTTNDIPGDTNYGTNQVIQLEYNNAEANYDLGHNWSSSDVFQLTLNAAPQAWNIHQARWIRPMIIQSSNNVVLWDPGETPATKLYEAPGEAQEIWAWNGPGPYGNSDWQSEPDTQFSFTIDASTFTAGTEGENIYLKLDSSGEQRGMYYDNVVLELQDPPSAIPEPSAALLGAIGGLLLLRRRR